MKFFDETVGYVEIKNKRLPVDMKGREHNPPHVHIEVGGTSGLFEIQNGNQWKGNVKGKHLVVIKAWILANRSYLKKEWNKRNPSLHIDATMRNNLMPIFQSCAANSMLCASRSLRFYMPCRVADSMRFISGLTAKLTKECTRSIHLADIYHKIGMNATPQIRYAQEIINTIALL